MKAAHAIQKAAAKAWNCSVREILFSVCLKMARAKETFVAKEKTMGIITTARIVRAVGYQPIREKIEVAAGRFTHYGVNLKSWRSPNGELRFYLNSKNLSTRKAFGYLKIVGGKIELWASSFTDAQDQIIETAINKIIVEMVAEDGAVVASKTTSKYGAETFLFDEYGRFISKYSNIGIGN